MNIFKQFTKTAFYALCSRSILPENSVVEIDVRDVLENVKTESVNKFKIEVFEEWMASLDPNTPNLTDEQISRESIYEEQMNRQL